MTLQRVLEPEVMDTLEEAEDYNAMDHSAVNIQYAQDIVAFANDSGIEITNVVDLGTGTALIPIELCKVHSSCKVVAVDMAKHMLEIAQRNIESEGLQDRISTQLLDAKQLPFEEGQFSCVISNSIIHHIPEPLECIQEFKRLCDESGIIFIRDLMRPESDEQVKQLVQMYAGDENEHSQQMFDDSLRAALSLDEIRDLVEHVGFPGESVVASSDRHWTWALKKS